MSTKEDEELLARFFDGEATPEEQARCEELLADPAHVARLEAMGELRTLMRTALVDAAPPVDVWPVVGQGIWRDRAAMRKRSFMRGVVASSGLLAAAAAIMLLVRPVPATNACDIETLDFDGSGVTVFELDGDRAGDPPATLIWMQEEEET